jgi:hypothetical protein
MSWSQRDDKFQDVRRDADETGMKIRGFLPKMAEAARSTGLSKAE